jgi:hypothetical protein
VVEQAEFVRGCRFLATVEGSSGWGGTAASDLGQENAENEARSKAGALGANMLVRQTARSGISRSVVRGDAYYCPVMAPASASGPSTSTQP